MHLIISTLKKQIIDLSCQNRVSLLGMGMGLLSASYCEWEYESNNDISHNKRLTRIPIKYDCR